MVNEACKICKNNPCDKPISNSTFVCEDWKPDWSLVAPLPPVMDNSIYNDLPLPPVADN